MAGKRSGRGGSTYIERRALPLALIIGSILLFILAFLPGAGAPPGNQPVVPLSSSTIVASGIIVGLVFVISAFLVRRRF